MKVCEKVQRKGVTSYNEVADELVAEFSDPRNLTSPSDQVQVSNLFTHLQLFNWLQICTFCFEGNDVSESIVYKLLAFIVCLFLDKKKTSLTIIFLDL